MSDEPKKRPLTLELIYLRYAGWLIHFVNWVLFGVFLEAWQDTVDGAAHGRFGTWTLFMTTAILGVVGFIHLLFIHMERRQKHIYKIMPYSEEESPDPGKAGTVVLGICLIASFFFIYGPVYSWLFPPWS